MFHKDLSTILAGRSLTPAEAFAMASPSQRRLWFGNEPPQPSAKASPYAAASPAQAPGLPAALERQVQDHMLSHYADPICPRCRLERKDGNARNGRCPHRPGPAELALKRAEARRAERVVLEQQARSGMLGTSSARVVTVEQATQEDSLRAELNAALDALLLGP